MAHRSRSRDLPRARRGRGRAAAGVLACLGVVAVLLATPSAVRAQGVDPSSTTVPSGTRTSGTGSGSASATASPSGQVAYATADGRVLLGEGVGKPVEIAQGAALGRGSQAALAVSPNADLVAFIRADGTLVTVPIGGGTPTVLATDAVTTSLGRHPSVAWNTTGDQIAYLARGTQAMVPPKPATLPPLSGEGVYRTPLPQGVLGDVVKVINRSGTITNTIGDPSVRSYTGITWSPSDDLMILDSVIPGTTQKYTLVAATTSANSETPTYFSADDVAFSPDGRFILAVGPAKGRKELIRISADTLDRTTLLTEDQLCAPSVSPDSTRVAYGTGPNCSRLGLISSKGGRAIDVTPPETPDTATFGVGEIGWTAEGRYLTHADCRSDAGRISCGGPVLFVDPDTGKVDEGPDATTVSPIRRPLIQDVYVDVDFRGPLKFRHSFLIDPTVQGKLTDTQTNGGKLEGRLVDGGTVLEAQLQTTKGKPFITGQITVTDPEGGIDRTFLVLGRAVVIGVRVFSLSGIWISTDDLPFATGKFNLAVRRR
jgi:hypothetical protein